MKKLVQIRKVLACTVAAASLLSMTALADEVKRNPLISSNVTSHSEETKIETKYKLVKGKIETITTKDGVVSITLSNKDMGVVANVKEDIFVVDQKDGSYKNIKDLKEGMEVTAILDNKSPMTMSIPPMTNGVIGIVINAESGFIEVSGYDDGFVSLDRKLQLNINKDVKIVDIKGTKKVFTSDDVKGSESLVFYTTTTKSIPAQTTPQMVMILSSKEESKSDETKEEVVALREKAEEAEFEVMWTSNDKPVIMEKGETKVEVIVGVVEYKVNGEVKTAKNSTALKDSKIYISSDVAELLK